MINVQRPSPDSESSASAPFTVTPSSCAATQIAPPTVVSPCPVAVVSQPATAPSLSQVVVPSLALCEGHNKLSQLRRQRAPLPRMCLLPVQRLSCAVTPVAVLASVPATPLRAAPDHQAKHCNISRYASLPSPASSSLCLTHCRCASTPQEGCLPSLLSSSRMDLVLSCADQGGGN